MIGKGWSSGSLVGGDGGVCFCGKGCWSGGEGVEGTVGGCASVGEDVEVVERGLSVAYGGLRWGCGGGDSRGEMEEGTWEKEALCEPRGCALLRGG